MMRSARGVVARAAALAVLVAILALAASPQRALAQQCANPGNDGPGGTITGIINTYYPGTANALAGATSLTVGASSGAATPIASGDLLLVIQMQDAGIASTNNDSYGDGVAGIPASGTNAINNAGRYEFVRATSSVSGGVVSIVGEGAGSGLVNAYTNAAATGTQGQRRFQVIRVPQYSSATIGAGLVALYWSGTVGGVLVFDVAGTLNFNSQTITLTGRGFRGGGGRAVTGGGGGANTDHRTVATSNYNGAKAEGVAGTPRYVLDPNTGTLVDTGVEGYPNGSMARGAPGNAGGGGTDGNPATNDQNSGGGGGGNGGTGGTGGNTWSSNLPRGGYGGAVFSVATTRLAMGGGGGAGARNNSSGVLSSGGAGGGIVMIRAGATSGTATITTDGVTGLTPANDGGGGGGAGGSVLVYSASGGLAGLTVNARGAGGSNADVGGSPHGPGAGGGGGYVALSSAAAAITVTGGAPGFTVIAGNNYSATAGTAGSSVTNLTSAGITGVNPSSECVPQITVVKTTSTPTIVNGPSGTTATYTLTITNTAGLSTATQVAVLDTLPTGFTFASTGTIVLSGGATRPSTTNPTVGDVIPSWSTFTIPSGGSVVIPFTANVASSVTAGTYQNPATSRYLDAKRTTLAGTTTSTYIASGSTGEDVTVTIPDLSLDKRHTAAFTVGQNGVYMIVVRNVGNAATVGTVTVLDTIPATLTSPVGAGAGWTCTTVGQIVTATYAAAIAAGDSARFTITAGVTAAAYPSVINSATASGGGDNSAANNRDSDPTAITGVPDVTIDKRHIAAFTVGQSASYTIVVRNIGTAVTANPVVVRDTLPAGLTGATGSGAGWTYADGAIEVATLVGSIAAGDSAKFTVTVNVGVAAYLSVTNAATVSLTGDLDPSNNRDTDPTAITGTPDVTIDKRHTAAFTVGQSASYTIVVRNIGTGPTAGAVTVRDTLPVGLSGATGAGGAGWSFSDGAIEVATYAPVIAAGDSAKFTLTVNVGAAAFPSVTNAATVSLAGDLDPSNNRDTDPTAITGVPDVTIDKRHTAAFTVGQAASYTIVVRNIGTVATASTTTVLDTLPVGLTPGTGSGAGWSVGTAAQIVTATFAGAIAAGDSAQFTIPVTVDAAAYPSVINAATVGLTGDLDPTNNRDTDPTAITGVPDVTIDKRHIAAFTVGQSASYTIVVRNIGTVATVGATTVRDTLPVGLTYGAGSGSGWSFSNSGQTVTAIFAASIADGDSAQFTLPVTVDATAFPSVINAASASSANDLDPSNNRDTDPTAITGVADLSIDKRHTAVFVDGQSGLYRFVVTNLGTAPSVGVVTVSDTLPAGLTYVPGVTPDWTVSNTLQIVTATYNLAIAPLDSAQFTVTVSISTPAVPGVINAATVSNASDVNPANDRDLDPTTVNGSTDVAIDKRHTGEFEINTNDTYTIVVRNVGTGSAGNFALADTLPAGLTYFSYAGAGWTLPVLAGQIVSTSFPGTLAAGDSAIFTLTVTVDVTAFPVVVNSAVVNAPGDVNPANDRDVDTTRVRARPDLSITKRHSVAFVDGQDAAWTIVLKNVSSVPTSIAATVTDTLPNGISFDFGTGAGWTFSSNAPEVTATYGPAIAPGDSAVCTLNVGVGPAAVGTIVNTAWLSGAGEVDFSNNVSSDPVVVQGTPELGILKRHTAPFVVGQTGTYTLVVTNFGTASISGPITVRDTLPAGLTRFAESGSDWTFAWTGQALLATHATAIAAGDSSSFTLTTTVDASAYPLVTNRATLSAVGDPNPANNIATDPTPITGVADLTIDKRHTAAFTVGQPASYTLVVSNIGTGPTSGLTTVRDTLPAGLTYIAGVTPGWSFSSNGQAVQADFAAAIAAGDSAQFTLDVSVSAAAVPGVTNWATVSGAADLDPTNDRDSDPTAVTGAPDLVLIKRHTTAFTVGQNADYQFVVRNIGSAASGAVTVVDTLPPGLSLFGNNGAGWSFSSSGQIVTAVLGAGIANADSAKFTLTVAVAAAAYPLVINTALADTPGELNPPDNFASDSTVITGVPDMTLIKRHTAAFTVGQPGTYTIVATNVGTAATTDPVIVTDALPAGLSNGSGSGAGWVITGGAPVTATHVGLIAAGDSAQFTLTVDVGAAAFPSVTNTATVSTTGDPNPGNDTGGDFTPVAGVPDMAIDKRHTGPFVVGQAASYTIVVRNFGTTANSGTVSVVDTLPAGLSFAGVNGAGWVLQPQSGQLVSVDFGGTIAVGDSAQFTLSVNVLPAAFARVTNSAVVTTTGDVDAANDRDVDSTAVTGAPDLSIDKRHTTTFKVGQPGTYTIVVHNIGTAATTGTVTVTDTLPSGLSNPLPGVVAGWDFGVSGAVVTANFLGSIAALDSAQFTFTVSVGVGAFASVINAATITAAGDYDLANNRDADPTVVTGVPDVAIDKRHVGSLAVNQDGTYTIGVSNIGTAATTDTIHVTDTLPTGLTFVSATGAGWTISELGGLVTADYAGVLAVSDSATFTLTVHADALAYPAVTNTATVATVGDLDPSNNSDPDPANVLGVQDIAVDKRHTTNFTVGQNGSYEIVITNVGTVPTVGAIALADTLPTGLAFVSATGAGWTISESGGLVTADYAAVLAVGDSAKFSMTVAASVAAQPSVTNFATATTSGDLNPTNDRDGDLTVVGGFPDLAIDKRHTRDFTMGGRDTFTIVVTNLGALPTTTETVVSDTLPAGLTEDTGTQGPGWVITVAGQRVTSRYAASIAPGDSAKFQIVVAVLQAAYPTVTNKATVRVTGGADLNATNDVDADSVNVIGAAELAIQKSHVAPNFTVGKNGSYQLTALNSGVVPALPPTVVVDSLPRGLKFVSATGGGWTFSVNTPDSNIVTATRASVMNVNQPANFNITVHVGPTAFPADTNVAVITGTSDVRKDNNRATSPTAILGAPDLSLDKRHTAAFVPGSPGTYDFVVRNSGIIATFDSIKVTDVLPNGLTFASGSGAGWTLSSPDGQTVNAFRLPAPALAVGDSTKFSIIVNVTGAAVPSVINTATVSTTNDYDPSNDTDSDLTTVSGSPDLSIDKRHTTGFSVGQNAVYEIMLTNIGPAPTVQATTIIDTLPPGLGFVSASGPPWLVGVSGQEVTAIYPNPIAAGDSVALGITVAVLPLALPAVINSAVVSNADDANAANDRDTDPATVTSVPDLALDKRHTAAFTVGQNSVYTFVVSNVGAGPTTGMVTVTDVLPSGLTYVSNSGAPWSVAVAGQTITATLPSTTNPIAAGDSSKFTLTVAVAAGAYPSVTNSATAATAGDVNAANNSDSDPAAVAGAPDLTIDKRHVAPFAQGQLGLYTLVVRNIGNVLAGGPITVRDTLPTGMTFSVNGSDGAGWIIARLGAVVTATFSGNIASGDSAKFNLEVNLLATSPPSKINSATVSGGGDTTPGNNRDSDPTAIAGTADLTIDKRHTTAFVVGQPGVYTLVVRNVGNDASAGSITVRDSLPAGLTYSSAAGAGWTVSNVGQVFTALFAGSIALGDSAKLSLNVNVLPAAAPSVTNTATVSGGGETNPGNNTDSDVTRVTGTPELTIDKRHNGPFRLNNSGTYSFVVTNLATAPSAGTVTVTDTLPAGLTYLFGTGTDWTVTAAGQIVTARHDNPIAGGDSARFTIVVTIGDAALPSVTNSAVVSGGGDGTPANNRDSDAVQITGKGVLVAGKSASPTDIEVGGLVDFAVTASNIGDGPVTGAEIVDVLPEGLRYVPGSARLDGAATREPAGAPGPQLRFPLGTLIAGGKVGLTYRVTVGSGSELGSGRNVALIQGTDPVTRSIVSSNVAAATIVIRPGVFGDEGIIAGKVIADCDCAGDGLQGNEDLGIPGVRLYLEDGTSAVTDVEGKYSFNHIRPRLHVVRIDETTLPGGSVMKAIANRNAGSGISQFVDLKRGEFHRVDFAESSRSPEVLASVKARREGGEVGGAIFGDGAGDRGDDSGAGPGAVTGGGTGSAGGRNSGKRSLLALGLLNARLDWYHLTNAKLMGSRHDRFEDELNDISHESGDGTSRYAGRAALFLNGTTSHDVRVSLRYDSERETERRLFRDIRPDEGYAMLGDASVHGFETQSAGRLFARAERNNSFAQYGDFSTPMSVERSLGAFSRRLNGGLGSLSLGRTKWGAFASQGHQRQVIDEFQAQGISGPYTLSRPDGTLGSELVELITRDRNQPARIISRVSQVRFVDYTLEAFTGRLVFRHPIASIDEQFNPLFIRVTYESDQAVDKFWVYGAQARVTPFSALSIGGAASQDNDPLLKRSIVSGDATLKLGSVLTLSGEVARSDSGQTLSFSDVSPKSGKATRLEAIVATQRLGLKLRTLRTDINFDNPSSGAVAGREEQGFDVRGGLGSRTTLFGNGLRTRDLATDGVRKGMLFGISEALPHRIGMEAIWRWSKEGAIPASALSGGTVPSTSSSLGGKLTLPLPWIKNGTVFGEGEQELTWFNRHRFALGGDIQVTQKTRLFVRHENVASLSGPFALNDFQQQENTVVGLASDDFRNGHVFSEYRMRDAAAGREAQAAMGLRNRWALPDGWFMDAGLERVIIVRGGSGASMAVTSALEYTGSPLWKGTVRAEWRRRDTNDQWLSGMTMERKLSRNLAALGRTDWFRNIGDGRTDGRSQFGVAYRGTETNRLSLLARYDNRIEYLNGTTYYNRVAHVLSSHANWQPRDKVTLSGQLASKWARDDHDGIFSTNSVKLVAARALVDLTRRFDVGALGRTEFGGGLRYGVGGELGYLAARNMRLAAGYNVVGYGAADMLGEERTDRGPYLDFGFKFDPFWGGPSHDAGSGASR